MKFNLIVICALCYTFSATSQTPITAVTTASSAAASTFSYTSGGNTYNWGLTPNNATVLVNGFTAGVPFSFAPNLTGNVKLRRVNNALITGNFTLVWAEVVNGTNTFNMFPQYQNDMEPFFNNRTYNKGTDNFFDNTSPNSNNIERLDWLLTSSYSTSTPASVGFAVFERGAVGAHDAFCIAAITSVDAAGNPASYGNIVRVATANYGEPGPEVTYRILKATVPANLLDAGTNTQNRGGVIISFQNLGIAANTRIFGYSLFSGDLPAAATPANLVDFTNATFFPINTGNDGGIDLVAVTGIYIANSVLPVRFISFNAVENYDNINLRWNVENETSVDRYEIERSTDGIKYFKISEVLRKNNSTGNTSYSLVDNAALVSSNQLYYRIKQFDLDGSYYYSKTIAVKRNNKTSSVIIYPNPVIENLYLNVANTASEKAVITIFNSTGSQVIMQQENLVNGNNSLSIDGIDRLAKGNYLLTILWNSGKKEIRQFSKQ